MQMIFWLFAKLCSSAYFYANNHLIIIFLHTSKTVCQYTCFNLFVRNSFKFECFINNVNIGETFLTS